MKACSLLGKQEDYSSYQFVFKKAVTFFSLYRQIRVTALHPKMKFESNSISGQIADSNHYGYLDLT